MNNSNASLWALWLCMVPVTSMPPTPKLAVFILAGQSNMQGHGYVDKYNSSTKTFFNGTLE